ncbi:MAG: amidohydrolase [Deltaproteobacteria bacterium]|nr:amidohydrolase [Deltaproteobacteria bacterium]
MAAIDADAHVLETERTWHYMKGSEREFRPVIVSAAGPGDTVSEYWLIDGRLQPKSQNVGQDAPRESREMEDIEARIRHMDELEVGVQVLYPSIFLRPITNRPEIELALSRSYNRWLVDICEKGKGRLRWVAVLPLLSMDRALEEARFAKEKGACGIFIRGLEGERRLCDPYFFPLYEEASRLNLPICVHSATGSFTVHDFFVREPGFCKFKLAVVGAFHSLIFDGIPDRFPGLKFAFIEVSAQWIPYAIHDLAKRFERLGKPLKKNLLKDSRIYVACQTDDDLGYVVQYAGEDNLVIGSDYGHADTASEIEALRRLREKGEVDPAVINKILDDNPRALYGL